MLQKPQVSGRLSHHRHACLSASRSCIRVTRTGAEHHLPRQGFGIHTDLRQALLLTLHWKAAAYPNRPGCADPVFVGSLDRRQTVYRRLDTSRVFLYKDKPAHWIETGFKVMCRRTGFRGWGSTITPHGKRELEVSRNGYSKRNR